MTNPVEGRTPSDVVGARVRAVRRRHGWTAAQLAERCAEIGATEITSSVVTDLETGRRDKTTGRRRRNITVDELLVLACALDVAPVHLLVPLEEGKYWITPRRIDKAGVVRQWIRGREPLARMNRRFYFTEVPEREWERPDPPDMSGMSEEDGRKLMELIQKYVPGQSDQRGD